ncbi:MAG: hypothetical protein JSS72_10855 [Armatimonadetes bacterium]|nr:hypothetical protein [Armatimonadota bacterium]
MLVYKIILTIVLLGAILVAGFYVFVVMPLQEQRAKREELERQRKLADEPYRRQAEEELNDLLEEDTDDEA